MGAYDDLLADVPAKKSGAYDDLISGVDKPEPSLKDKIYKAANKLFQPSSVIDESNINTKLTGFDNTGAFKRVIQNNTIPNNLQAGSKIVDGLTGIAEVGGRKGYAGLGRIEAGAIKALADVLGSETLSNAAKNQQNYANQVEGGAVLRGKPIEGFAKESIVQDLPGAASNAISSVITTAPSLAAGAIAPELTFPVMFATTGTQEYGQGRESGLNPAGAALRAIPQAALEVIGEKVGGSGQLADALHAAVKGNGFANLGSAMIGSAIKELPGEELTTTGQFLVDKVPGIGTNQEAGINDYGQQVKDTALATLLQSGAMAGGGHILNTTAESTQSAPVINESTPEATQNNQFDATATIDALNQAKELVKPRLEVSNGTQADDVLAAKKQVEYDAQTSHATPTYDDLLVDIYKGATNEQPITNAAVGNGAAESQSDNVDRSAGTELLAQPAEPNNAAENTQGSAGDISSPMADKPNRTLKQKSNTLLTTLRDLGGVSINDKLDVTGEDKGFAPGGYNQIFRNNARQSLKGHIESGTLDDYLPPAMRLTAGINDNQAFDSTEAYDYLSERIRNGEKVIPYDAEQEINASKYYQEDDATAQSDIAEASELFNEDEINEQLRIASSAERETATQARQLDTGSQGSIIERGTGNQATEQPEPKTISTPTSEREGVRPLLESVVKRRSAANQLGKSKPFDAALQLAKDFMAGNEVKPAKFKNAATLFKNDKVLSDAFIALHELAKAPAKEAKGNINAIIETYKGRIDSAKNASDLHELAHEIQDDTNLSDSQAQMLDDLVFDAQDKLDAPEERRVEGAYRVERRTEEQTRKNVNEMTPDEMRLALLVDDLTGIGNRRAYDESIKKPIQVSIDADGLKWVNDNLGHESGDILLHTIGEALGRITQDSYHISGDEFVVQANSDAVASDIMEAVNELLAEATVEGVNSNGDKVILKGIGISYGIAKDLKDAENKLQQHKSEREQSGHRSGRGEQPANATISSQRSENNQDNAAGEKDLLGQDTTKQQALSDAEYVKDTKRNSGTDNQDTFNLTGSTSEADQAAAAGARPLFSRSKSNDVKDLFVQHNISESGLINADKMGGLAVPSLAVTNKNLPVTSFGEITLLASKDLIDPKKRTGGRVFGADIYSPRYPEVTYFVDKNVLGALNRKLEDSTNATGDSTFTAEDLEKNPLDKLSRSIAVKHYFLIGKGVNVKSVMKKLSNEEKLLLSNKAIKPFIKDKIDIYDLKGDDFAEAYFQYVKDKRALDDKDTVDIDIEKKRNLARNGAYELRNAVKVKNGEIDKYAVEKSINEQIDSKYNAQFNDYVHSLFESLGAKEKLFKGHSYSGNRQYIDHSLDNVIKHLKKDLRGGENWNYGLGSVRSKFTPEFKSIAEIKKNKDRIISTDQFETIKSEQDAELFKLAARLEKYHPASDRFGFLDTVTSVMSESASIGINRALNENGFNEVPDEIKQDLGIFLDKLKNMPSEYFEAKVLRQVGLNEFSGAVVPKATSNRALEILNKNGITNIYFYGNNDSRESVIQSSLKDLDNKIEGGVLFNRDVTAKSGLSNESIQNAVNNLSNNWKNAPKIIVVDDMNDPAIRKAVRDENERQLSQGATGQPEGFFDAGKVYVVASEMGNTDDVQRVVFHETLGHFGLQGTFGNALDDVLDKLYELRRTDVLKKAKQYGLDFTNQKDRRIAAEEVLAEMAQTNPQIGFVKRAIAAIRQWLRDNGFNLKLSDSDIIANYLLPARDFVQRGKQEETASSIYPAFIRTDDAAKPVTVDSRDNWIFRRDELGNIQLAPTGKAYDFISNITQNIANKANFGMASPELRRQIRHFKTDMQKALDVAENVAHGMQKMTPEDRAIVSDVVEGMLKTGTIPPQHVLDVAANMQSIMDTQTDELVKLGMLNKDAAERWRGKYLPRFYNRDQDPALTTLGQKLLRTALPIRGLGGGSLKGRGLYKEINVRELDNWEALGWEVRDTLWKKNRQGKLELIDQNNVRENETVMIWRDYTQAERESMGENRDAMFRFVMGYTAMQNDIALGRLFDGIASNQEWTRSRPSEGYTKVPDSEIAETGGVKKYGNLAGLYVRDDIMQHISQYEQSSDLVKYYRKALSFWKAGKTVLNPVSHMNNMVSNLTMAHFAGVSYWDTHKYIGAIRDFVKDAPMIQEAKDVGLMTGDITRAELIAEMPDDIKAMMNSQDSKITKSTKATYNVLTFGLTKPMSKAYRFEDDFFKYLIYKEARANGVSPDDAVDYATKYIFNYDDLPKTARLVRDAAIPFFAYTYKAVPALAYTAFNYPWRFAAPAAAIYGLNALAYGLIAGDDDDDLAERFAKGKELEAEERKNLPPWMQGKSALGTEKTIRLGTDEKTGLPIYMDISRFMPGGDMFDIAHGDFTTLPAPITPSNPVLTIIAALMPQINKDMFTGKDIIDKNDTPAEAAKKRASWLIKQISPAIAPTGYHAEKLLNAGALMADTTINIPFVGFGDDVEYTGFGKDGLPVQPKYAAMNVLGVKAKPTDLELSAEISQGQDNSEIKSIKAEIRQAARLLDKGAISQRAYDKTEADGIRKVEDIINKQ